MKKKTILSFTLALAMGLGVAVGLHANEAKATKADGNTTLYCKMTYSWWTADSAAIGVYYWGGSSTNTWPGTRLTEVEDNIWKASIPSDSTGFIFTRVNGSGNIADWGAKTADLAFPTGGENLYTITSSTAVWGDPGVTGEWSTYTEPATKYNVEVYVDGTKRGTESIFEGQLPEAPSVTFGNYFTGWYSDSGCTEGNEVTAITSNTTVYGKVLQASAKNYEIDNSRSKYSDLYYYAFDSYGNINAEWPGTKLSSNSVNVPSTAKFVINDNNGQQTVDITPSSTANDKLIILATKEDSKNKVAWASTSDIPAEDGYYLVGDYTNWKFAGAQKLGDGDDNNNAILENYTVEANKEYKVRSYINEVEEWYGVYNEETQEEDNYVSDEEKAVNFYASKDGTLYVTDYIEPVVETYSVKYNTETVEFVNDDENKPDGAEHQYKATITTAIRARDLEFYVGETKITENIGIDRDSESKIVACNNIAEDGNGGFKIYTSADSMDIYLKTYSDGGKSLWGTGYAENTFGISPFHMNLWLDTDFVPDGTYIEQYRLTNGLDFTVKGESETKYYFSDVGGYMQTINIEAVAGNNAVAVQDSSSYFNVHNDCTEVPYLKMKADLSLWLYIGGYSESHVLTIGGKEVALTKYSETEYKASGVALSAGDKVTGYNIEGTAVEGLASKKVGNNNLSEAMEVIANVSSADIYYNVSAKSLFITGLPQGGYHIIKGDGSIVQLTATDPYDGYLQYKSELINFAKDDTFQFIDTNGAEGENYAVIFSVNIINEGGLGANFEIAEGAIKCKTACESSVYLKLKSGVDEIYFGTVEQYIIDAKNFADGFKSAMATACVASNMQEAVEEAWANQATAYKALDEKARAELYLGSYSSVDEVREFAERYLTIASKHKTWDLENFLEWDIPNNPAIYGNIEFTAENNSLIIIISAISAATIAGAALLLILKKKKHSK